MLQRSLFIVTALYLGSVSASGKSTGSILHNTNVRTVLNWQQPQQVQPVYNYKIINSNLEYACVVNKPTSPNPKEGDQISVNMQMICNNKLLFNSAQTFKGKPAVYGVNKPGYKGDIIDAIILMTPGDSIVCLADADALFKNTKNKRPDFIKPGDKIQYFIKLISIKTKEQLQKEQQDAFNKQINEQIAKQKQTAEIQGKKGDNLLKNWFAKKNISPMKTTSGLYYIIKEEGNGEKPIPGDSITVNYTGTLLDGTKFDSNEDTAFHHAQPIGFILGRGEMIRGWDEGFPLLKVGSKASFYVPSTMAYGIQSRPGSSANPKGIPPNSILMFDVELLTSRKIIKPVLIAPQKDSSNSPLIRQ